MRLRIRNSLYALAAATLLCNSSCAYLFHGTSDEIHIQSGNPKAELYLDDEPVGIASATATVDRDKTYTIQAKASGCETRTVQTGDKFDPISLLGLFLDAGIISILIIDMGISGAAWKTYPITYTVNPICPPTPEPVPAAPAATLSAPASPAPSAVPTPVPQG
ncbi:MAG TPA: hypothetical protein VNF27_09995 [Candidatus Binataceae bacterium]|nr:hypothetical protein [Candidatus Binataceae bacterium]